MKKLILFCCLLAAVCVLSAQNIQGIFQIGGSAADFEDLDLAIDAIRDAEVVGDIYLYINPGTYTGPYVISDMGLGGYSLYISSVNDPDEQILFTNHNAGSADNYIILIQESSNITITGIDFAPTGSYARSIMVLGNSNHINLIGNRFFNPGTSSQGIESIYFASVGSSASDHVNIRFNQFFDGSHHIVLNNQSSTSLSENWVIESNMHQGLYYATNGVYSAISMQRVKNLTMRYNQMFNVNSGISLSSLSGNLLITNNRVNAWASGISIGNSSLFAHQDQPNVYNNIIRASGYNWYGGYGSRTASGLIVSNCSNVYAAHNSVELSSADSGSIVATISGTNNVFRKNHFVNMGAGYVLNFAQVNEGIANRNIIDYNNIYGRGTYLGRQMNTYYQEMVQMIGEFGFYNADFNPFFEGDYLSPGSAYLDNNGPHVGVDQDYFGEDRDPQSPDIGAVEYSTDPSLGRLSGTYTIGEGQDFASINDFARALSLRGVIGPVTAHLEDDEYSEQIVFDRIPGIGHDRWVTIRGNAVEYSTLSFSDQSAQANYIVATYRSKYLKFERLSFVTEAQDYSRIMEINGFAGSIYTTWCHFVAPQGLAATDAKSSIYVSDGSSTSDATYDLRFSALSFNGNGYGIYLRGKDHVISNSHFQNLNTGIYLYGVDDPWIDGNLIENISAIGINVNSIKSGNIFYNKVLGGQKGISVGNSAAAGEATLIANNLIGASSQNGLWLSGSNFKVLNNSISVVGVESSSGLYSNQLGSNIEIVNNILQASTGYAMEITYYNDDPSHNIDYNSYLSEGNYLLKMGGIGFKSLAHLQETLPDINEHSVNYDPLWDEGMMIQSQYLRGIGQFRTEFDDDINRQFRGYSWDIGAQQQFGVSDLSPLTGSYSVGSPDADFPTIEDSIWALRYHGISGHTFFNIAPGTYDGGYRIRSFPGANESSKVFFRGSGGQEIVLNPTSTSSDENYLFMILAASGVRLEDMRISSSSPSVSVKFIRTSGRCDDIQINNLEIILPGSYSHAISTGSSLGDGLTVQNCQFSGPGFGIVVHGGGYYDSSRYQDISIHHNTFNTVTYPISVQKVDALNIGYNVMNDFNQALNIINIGGFSTIHRNRLFTQSSGSSNSCLAISNAHGSSDPQIYIFLNMLYFDSPSLYTTGLSISNSSYLQILHNTIVTKNRHNNLNGLTASFSGITNSVIQNNVFASPEKGYALSVSGSSEISWNNNAYFNNLPHLGRYNNTLYSRQDFLESMIEDFTAVYANPMISDNGYNSCSYLRNRGTETVLEYDIDGNPWEGVYSPGANVIEDGGWQFTSDIQVGPSGDFQDLESAVYALMKRGAQTSLTVHLAPGVYQGNIEIGHIPGLFGDGYVRIKGPEQGDAVITFAAASLSNNFIFRLTNTRNLIFEDLSLSSGNPEIGTVFLLNLFNDGLRIQECEIYGAGGSTNNACGIYGTNSYNRDLRFENNLVQGLGYAASIHDGSDLGSYVFSGNEISEVHQGFSLQSMPFVQILGNSISGSSNSLSLVNINDFIVQDNILSCTNGIGIYVSATYQSTGAQDIFNNYVLNHGPSTVSLHRSANARLYHNTLVNLSSSINSKAFVQNTQCPSLDIRNNIITSEAGVAAIFNSLNDIDTVSSNIYYSSSGIPVRIASQDLGSYSSYEQATSDAASFYADPLLEDGTYILASNSVAINAGDVIDLLPFDIVGTLRTLPDIGCYEYIVLALDSPQNLRFVRTDNGLTLFWDAVPEAQYYKVFLASDPYADLWEEVSVQATEYHILPGSNHRFYKVIAVSE